MKRRSILILLLAVYVAGGAAFGAWASRLWLSSNSVKAAGEVLGASTSSDLSDNLLSYPTLQDGAKRAAINARQYVLYHVESGKVLVNQEGDKQVPIASTTKLMTSHLVAKLGDLDAIVTVSKTAASTEGSIMGLLSGEQISVHNLLYGLMLVSGNDAAHALAEHYGRKLLGNPNATEAEATERFVQEMNTEAAALSLTNTTYKDPAGLNDEGHSTAVDLAKLTSVVNQQDVLHEITTTPTTTVTSVNGGIKHDLRNSNHLVADGSYQGIVSGKTGFTPAAGHCLVTSARQGNNTLVVVILSTYVETKTASATEAKKLLEWGFANYRFE